MKKVLFIAIIGSLSGFFQAQTALEKAFLDEMNAYRKKKNIATGIYHSGVSSVAAYHCKYLVKCLEVGHSVSKDKGPHDEQFDIANHQERTFEQRTGMAKDLFIFGEISYPVFFADSSQSVQEVAREIVLGFSRSPGHNQLMITPTDPNQLLVGVSILPSKSDFNGHINYSVNVNFAYK
jgi:hypothetical protein